MILLNYNIYFDDNYNVNYRINLNENNNRDYIVNDILIDKQLDVNSKNNMILGV